MRIAAYCRVSTDKAAQLDSLAVQKRFFEEYAARNGDKLINVYADEGISGTKLKKRQAFLQLMADAEEGLFDQVVTKDVARFARNAVDFLQCVRRLKSLGIPCLFITANMTSRDSELVLGVLALAAQEESVNTSKRIKFTKRINAEKGRVPNLVYGYDKIPGDFFHLGKNETEAAVVQRIFVMYAHEGLAPAGIARRLNQEGIKTKRGAAWSQSSIARILENRIYIGYVTNGKEEIADVLDGRRKKQPEESWKVVERPELRIIDPKLYTQAQQERTKRQQKTSDKQNRTSDQYPFSSLLFCGCCGAPFRRIKRTYRNTYAYWVCGRRNCQGTASCSNSISISEAKLHEAVKEYLGTFLPDSGKTLRMIASFMRQDGCNEQDIEKKQIQLENTRQRYLDMYGNGIVTMKELTEKNDWIQSELDRLASRKRIAHTTDSETEDTFKHMVAQHGGILPIHLEYRFLHCLIERIVADPSGCIRVEMKKFSDVLSIR
ncbi:MAG: recombinase family protein [Christensenellales bacterium]